MERRIITTEDGSHTIFVPELDEHYHSTHGAVQESQHVFIKYGLEKVEADSISIFEVGFGTGLNAILTYAYAKQHGIKVIYHGIEKYPVSQQMVGELNYTDFLPSELHTIFDDMHRAEWEEEHNISEFFTLKKIEADLIGFQTQQQYDLIYFDAFAPSKQSEMWTTQVFDLMGNICKHEGLLTTYSSKGDVKRALKAAGFKVSKYPGPPGKRDMVCAQKIE